MEESTNSPSSSEQSSDNVVPFPTRVVASVAPVKESSVEEDREYVDELVRDLAVNILSELYEEGVDINTKIFDKNFGFMVETLRSTLYATLNIEHPFQEIVDKCVKLVDEIDETEHANDDDEFDPA
jgi:hypothetical protein